ncbi:MAG: hypothetical protein RLZZ303_283 [Candidatus Hydrogenedentota bacterium]
MRMPLVTRLCSAMLALCAVALTGTANAEAFEETIRPLVQKYCVECHRDEKLKGDLNLARFESMPQVVEALAVWQRSAKRIESGEMPPGNAPKPTDEERKLLVEWINGIKADDLDCTQIVSEASQSWYPGYVMSRRLNRFEYENTIRDLLGIEMDLAAMFPADGAGGEGFDTNGNALFISAIQMEKYVAAADLVIETAFSGARTAAHGRLKGQARVTPRPDPVRQQQADARRALLTASPGRGLSKRDAATRVCLDFTERAWRRPVNPEEIEGLLALFDKALQAGDRYDEAIRLPLKAALVSPHFLFLAEPEPTAGGVYPLGDYPLASRLSYFLWGSMPDDSLFELARQGQLRQPEVLEREVKRMLRDPKALALGELFAGQWLGVSQLGELTRPDETRYPEFDEALAEAERQEVALLFQAVVAENRPITELIHTDFTFVNEALAEIYGIEGVKGPEMRRVQLADARRGGVLGMAGVLTATSHPLRTSPVLRGKWVLEQILGERVPPPPPGVPPLPEDEHHLEGMTLRQRLEAHRANPECAACHQTMDPIGFGLENYDPVGRWREEQAGLPIDSLGTLPSGQSFNGPAELKEILLARKDDFARNLSRKMLGYALGRSLTRFDECVINDGVAALQQNEYRPEAMFVKFVLSHPFRHRYSAAATP